MKTSFCVFWTLFALFLLSISIFALLIGSYDERSQKLGRYTSAIRAWEEYYPEAFDDLQISPYIGPWDPQKRETHLLLRQVQDPEALSKDIHSSLRTYTSVFYEETFPDIGAFNISNSEFDEARSVQLSLDIFGEDYENQVYLEPVPLFEKRREGGKFPSGCELSGGYYNYAKLECITYWVIFK